MVSEPCKIGAGIQMQLEKERYNATYTTALEMAVTDRDTKLTSANRNTGIRPR
jgi:hypothetical protein